MALRKTVEEYNGLGVLIKRTITTEEIVPDMPQTHAPFLVQPYGASYSPSVTIGPALQPIISGNICVAETVHAEMLTLATNSSARFVQ